MLNITVIKNLIPYVFLLIIVGFIAKLGYDNRELSRANNGLTETNKGLTTKNSDLAATLNNLADRVGEQNEIVRTEAKRRAAAEMKQQRLQDEVKSALRTNTCSIVVVPADAAASVLKQAGAVRNGKAAPPADTSKSAD